MYYIQCNIYNVIYIIVACLHGSSQVLGSSSHYKNLSFTTCTFLSIPWYYSPSIPSTLSYPNQLKKNKREHSKPLFIAIRRSQQTPPPSSNFFLSRYQEHEGIECKLFLTGSRTGARKESLWSKLHPDKMVCWHILYFFACTVYM